MKKQPADVVKKTTKNGVTRRKTASSVKRVQKQKVPKRKRVPNPTGKNQVTYKSARDAMHIYCENHPEKVVAGIEAIMKGVAEGNPAMIKLWIDIFGGPDKQQLELGGGVEVSGLKVSFADYSEDADGNNG